MSTKKLNRFIIVVPAVLCIALAGCRTAYTRHKVVAAGPVSEPLDVVESFYSSYASLLDNPMIDRAYRSDGRLTPEFIQKMDAVIASFDKGGYDPFLCAQDIPGEFAFDDALVSGEEATVVVHQVWNPGTEYEFVRDVTVALRRADGQWKINDVICPEPEAADPLPEDQFPFTPGQAVKAFYGWYIWHAREIGSPLADGAYRSSEYLTPRFIQRVDEIIASFNNGGYDPLLCAQDIPGKFTIGKVDVTGETASVELNEIWNPETEYETVSYAVVELQQIDERWLIDDVLCLEWDPLAPISEPPKATTPEEAVRGFYDWYLASSAYDEEAGTRLNPLADGRYRSSEYLAEEFVQKVDGIVASFDKGGYDPILCAQDLPESFTLDEVVLSGDTARLVVHTSFEGHMFTVELQQVTGQWKISDVLCGGDKENDLGVEGWQVLTDESYGFTLRFPEDWTYEEGQVRPPEERADGEKALQRVLFLQPQGWDGVAPPLHVQVTDGTQEEFERLYVPPTSVEKLEVNGLAVTKEVEDIGGVQVTRYVFQSPTDETIRIVVLDSISGFPERAEGNDEVIDTLRRIVQTITFIR
jgi:hypothetical protein